MGGGVHVGLGAGAEPGHGREHHRSEQDDGGVQAQHGRDHRGEKEVGGQQPLRPAFGRTGQPGTARLEEPLVVAELGEYQHRGQEAHDGPEQLGLGACVVERDRAGRDHHTGGRDRHGGLRQAEGPDHGTGQYRHEENGGKGCGECGTQGLSFGSDCRFR
jgi:hypothetical protein